MTDRRKPLQPGWEWVKFGDVVRLCTERSIDPVSAGIERYVGLEHMEPSDLRIRSWGLVADGVTFTNVFKEGQVLFGKRRAYQRKVAVADFEGVCSGDIYVLESSSARLLPGLVPYVCQSDTFFEHALKTSAGSLSPRTNWTSLSDFEFALPSISEQHRILQRCVAERNVVERLGDASAAAKLCEDSLLREMGLGLLGAVDRKPMAEVVQLSQYGISVAPLLTGDIPLLRMGNLGDGVIDTSDLRFVGRSSIRPDRDLLNKGDVLFNRTNSIDLVGKAAHFDLDGEWAFASYLIRLTPHREVVEPEYLAGLINSQPIRESVLAGATKGVSQANVNATTLSKIVLPIPSLADQRRAVQGIRELRAARESLEQRKPSHRYRAIECLTGEAT